MACRKLPYFTLLNLPGCVSPSCWSLATFALLQHQCFFAGDHRALKPGSRLQKSNSAETNRPQKDQKVKNNKLCQQRPRTPDSKNDNNKYILKNRGQHSKAVALCSGTRQQHQHARSKTPTCNSSYTWSKNPRASLSGEKQQRHRMGKPLAANPQSKAAFDALRP